MTTTHNPVTPAGRDIPATDPLTTFPGRFAGRSLIITGGARGIGRAVALRAAREGARVVVADILVEEGQATTALITEAGGQAVFVHTDVRSDSDCQRMVEAAVASYGSVDLALNAAGVMDGVAPDAEIDVASQRDLIFAPIHAATNAYWDQCFAVNVTGMFQSLRHELRQMLAQGNGGAVVNIGSIAALTGLGGNPAYTASKHAVTGLTRNAAIDYAPLRDPRQLGQHGRDCDADDGVGVHEGQGHPDRARPGHRGPAGAERIDGQDPEPAGVLRLAAPDVHPGRAGRRDPVPALGGRVEHHRSRVGHRRRLDHLLTTVATRRPRTC